ncbi:hypothetical protein EJ08DRAFT_659376 [Tothia fuscella]|uniref:Uncharacterized protein n=1 Tax=Tothia fuscella TaxID=1048955 RepID=A0A9P4U0K3_9PEZI|nr:hypothetical protein EJ08DRAFT_659376 [Tothia fuscella]
MMRSINTFDDDESSLYTPSISDRLSPTDGYFNDRQHPQETYVNTMQEPNTSKNDEVESLLNSCLSESSTFSQGRPTPSSSSVGSNERTPLLRSNSPPPAYRPRSVNEPSSSGNVEGRLNDTNADGRSSLFFSGAGTPQRMGDLNVESGDDESLYEEDHRRPRKGPYRKCIDKKRAIKALVLLIGVGILAWVGLLYFSRQGTKKYEIQHLESFKFTDLLTDDSNFWTTTSTIHVLSGPQDQKPDLAIKFSSTSPLLNLEEDVTSSFSGKSLSLQQSQFGIRSWSLPKVPCLAADIALYFRPGLTLTNFEISSASLTVFMSSALSVDNTTEISLKSGGLTAQPFIKSRKTYIDSKSNSISGTCPLYDLLSIRSQSGSISINVEPQKVDKEHPEPAVLIVQSKSGSVNINFPSIGGEIPVRDYQTTIVTTGGSIQGRYIHGTRTLIETQSARIDVSIVPLAANSSASTLSTKSQSGSQSIRLLSPHLDPGTSMNRLSSTHTALSGKLELSYPDEWEGRVAGQTKSGSLSVHGSGLSIIEQGSRGGGKYIVAKKGEGDSVIRLKTLSGSADVGVGF